jgi:3-oxoacyl-[acyl-carrier-protein] synthase III
VTAVGILGIGVHLPSEVRRNDWWPPEIVAGWAAMRPDLPPPIIETEGQRRIVAALRAQRADPFRGAVERHVVSDGEALLDLEVAAAEQALARSGVPRDHIDLLLTHSVVPEFWMGNPACPLHDRLGLPIQCFAMHVDASAYSFSMQLAIAEAMITAGRAHYALLTQGCVSTPLVDMTDPWSPVFGDGATAVVVGPVRGERGILAAVHFADGRTPKTVIASVPGKAWWDEGRAYIHVADEDQMRTVFLSTADACKRSVDAAVAKAGVRLDQIGVLAAHEGTPWLRQVVREYVGLDHARSVDSFSTTGYIASALIPANLRLAQDQGILGDDDLVVLTGGGTGMTYGATVIRWGA